ncbi:MAG: type I-C CRISPR-associated protein Cas8c/Csd1 [Schaedlerella sp.]|nr:type I-C CRISPR-associated protein Cas8c/Csd1 [Lachnospiraceae bacterium]MDY4203162.1 type I-C CRISPR-associated protein Cas8c/Csd1 [Schaedlerella sp.]
MILQALVDCYETLLENNKVAAQGWCRAKVSYALNLDVSGRIKQVITLKQEIERGKTKVWLPVYRTVPQTVSRSSGVLANFLCDNSKYILGVDTLGNGKRVQECFEASREKHLEILESVSGEMAEAVRNFFCTWNPEKAKENDKLIEIWEEITDGSNLIFVMNEKEAQDDKEIHMAWENFLNQKEEQVTGICLVTGRKDEIARIHSTIRGVQGAQSSGAALVSFNAPAFESYGKEQSYNASVGKYAAFAYTTALNYLLAKREYVFQFGDTTVVYWAEDGDEIYQDLLCGFLEPREDNQEIIKNIFQNLKEKRAIDVNGIKLNINQRFYILGLSPNAARLAVRFFYENSFGKILDNLLKHYNRMELVKPSREKREFLGVGSMINETINQKSKDKKPIPNLPGAVLRAVLENSRYPESLYNDILIRIRAEQGKITWGRAAIIKAYLIQNKALEKEENFVGLNQETSDTAYVLGRIFSVLEYIQKDASSEINATIKDRYFNAACANPVSVFPILMKLKNSHLRKIGRQKEWRKAYFEGLLAELLGKITEFPKSFTLEEQGHFILGYYHQVQKLYEKKEDE